MFTIYISDDGQNYTEHAHADTMEDAWDYCFKQVNRAKYRSRIIGKDGTYLDVKWGPQKCIPIYEAPKEGKRDP